MRTFRFTFLLSVGVVGSSIFIYSCAKDKTPAPVEPCDPNKVYFQRDILPIVSSNCAKSGCHDAATKVEGLNLSTYNGVMSIVVPGKPGSSELIEVINATKAKDLMPPAPNTPLTAEQKTKISQWISDGALNEVCVSDSGSCTTTTVSYAKDVSKIITTNCVGCHGGGTISKNIDLSSYNGVKSAASSGKLYNSIAQNGSASPMPKAPAQKLSACDISAIKIWVDAGSLNN